MAFLMVLCLCQMPQMVWAAEATEKMSPGHRSREINRGGNGAGV